MDEPGTGAIEAQGPAQSRPVCRDREPVEVDGGGNDVMRRKPVTRNEGARRPGRRRREVHEVVCPRQKRSLGTAGYLDPHIVLRPNAGLDALVNPEPTHVEEHFGS